MVLTMAAWTSALTTNTEQEPESMDASGGALAVMTVPVLELERAGSVRFTRREVPQSGALLRVEVAGICGTDRHIFGGRLEVAAPCALGHEVVGRIERISDEDGLVLEPGVGQGTRVLLAPGVPCGSCAGCQSEEARCEDRPVYGISMPGEGLTGGFAPLMALLPGTRLYAIPEALVAERAVFAETMACVLSGMRKAFGPRPAEPPYRAAPDALVMGFGPIGMCAAVAADAWGMDVQVADRDPRRRELARELGFRIFDEPAGGEAEASAAFDAVIDCAGTPAAFAAALGRLGRGGMLLELGNYADLGTASVRPSEICVRDLRLVGSGETLYEDFPAAIRLLAETPIELERAVTEVHRFAELVDPNELFATQPAGKAVISLP
jgi:threonine dehydrogenase-like Zn-dependent dehydrogenase